MGWHLTRLEEGEVSLRCGVPSHVKSQESGESDSPEHSVSKGIRQPKNTYILHIRCFDLFVKEKLLPSEGISLG